MPNSRLKPKPKLIDAPDRLSQKATAMPIALAPAKVNFTLHVGAPNHNGRHPLDSLTVFAGPEAADRIMVENKARALRS